MPVVDSEIPITVGARRVLRAGTSEGHGLHARKEIEGIGHPLNELGTRKLAWF